MEQSREPDVFELSTKSQSSCVRCLGIEGVGFQEVLEYCSVLVRF